MSRWKVIVRHTLPNAWAPIITVVALNMAYLITGVVLVEVVLSIRAWPTFSRCSFEARLSDMQACCLIFAATFILLNLAADVGAILSNPRLRNAK